MRRRERAPR